MEQDILCNERKKRTILYRGSLKSCNYKCSYCPFSKHRTLQGELEKDQEALQRFVGSVLDRAKSERIGAVFFTPYGEAMIHTYYWDAMAELSKCEAIDKVGIQTNLSFDGGKMLEHFERVGGRKEKLQFWGTFHPEMTSVEGFVERCSFLRVQGVSICAGAVGVPENIEVLESLRENLPQSVYLWINKMDGLGRNYTREEVLAFLSIDPFFERELQFHRAEPELCEGRCFVEWDGRIHTCNISGKKAQNWYESSEEERYQAECKKKICSCYLAYGGREDHHLLFGEYPLFRQSIMPKAVFVDIDGTLIPKGAGKLSERTCAKLRAVARVCPLFFVTSLPKEKADALLKKGMECFSGGAYGSGGYLWGEMEGKKFQKIFGLASDYLMDGHDSESQIDKTDKAFLGIENEGGREGFQEDDRKLDDISILYRLSKKVDVRLRVYKQEEKAYKVSLIKGRNQEWAADELEKIRSELPQNLRIFTEGNCLEIVSALADKGKSVREICNWLGVDPKDTIAFGNDEEDRAMKDVCGWYVEM